MKTEDIILTHKSVRSSCLKLSNLLNVKQPNQQLIDFIFSKFGHVTPATFELCCQKLMNYEHMVFPGMGYWNKHMESAARETSIKTATVKEIPIEDQPTREDWNVLFKILKSIEDSCSIKDIVKPENCKNVHMYNALVSNEEKMKDKKLVEAQVKKMRKFKTMSKLELLNYHCEVRADSCEDMKKCRTNKEYCEDAKTFVLRFKKYYEKGI